MKNSFKTVKIYLKGETQNLSLGYLPNKELNVNGKALLENYQCGCLIEKKHNATQTQFDLTGSESCILIIFDENNAFVTVKLKYDSNSAPVSFFISSPYVIIIPTSRVFPLEDIYRMEILDFNLPVQSIIDKIKRPWLIYWVDNFKKDSFWGTIRFKKLNTGYPPFTIPSNLIDVVEMDEFLKDEEKRLPLFIGSQFGIHPRLEKIYKNEAKFKVIAILSKSLLSGCVSSLAIYVVNGNDYNKVKRFENIKTKGIY